MFVRLQCGTVAVIALPFVDAQVIADAIPTEFEETYTIPEQVDTMEEGNLARAADLLSVIGGLEEAVPVDAIPEHTVPMKLKSEAESLEGDGAVQKRIDGE